MPPFQLNKESGSTMTPISINPISKVPLNAPSPYLWPRQLTSLRFPPGFTTVLPSVCTPALRARHKRKWRAEGQNEEPTKLWYRISIKIFLFKGTMLPWPTAVLFVIHNMFAEILFSWMNIWVCKYSIEINFQRQGSVASNQILNKTFLYETKLSDSSENIWKP